MARLGLAPDTVDDLVLAENYQGGGVIARNIAVRAGCRPSRSGPEPVVRRRAVGSCDRRRIGESRNGPHGAGRWDRA